MAKPKLTDEQREALLTWLAADYSSGLIAVWFKEREWPELNRSTLTHYRDQCRDEIEALRKARRESALNTGLALKEERIARLKTHADALEAIKWAPDKNGRMWNEKAWRETLDDIAKEMGDRSSKQANERAFEQEWIKTLEHLRTTLEPNIYAQIVAALTGGTEGGSESTSDV